MIIPFSQVLSFNYGFFRFLNTEKLLRGEKKSTFLLTFDTKSSMIFGWNDIYRHITNVSFFLFIAILSVSQLLLSAALN